VADIASWTCPSCNATVSTPYCPACGEALPQSRDLTLRGLSGQLFNAFSSIDSKLVRSFRMLVNRPGALTVAYVQGQRLQYLGPIALFLIANVLFFAVQSLTGAHVFSSTLDSHLFQQDWSELAQTLVAHRLSALQMSLDRYAPLFNQAAVLNAKAFIILMVLPFALLLPVTYWRERKPFVAHAVFSLHLYAFLLLLFCFSLAIAAVDVALGGAGLKSAWVDNVLSVFNLAACAIYLYVATGAVYGARGIRRAVQAIALAVAAIVVGYRFVIFLVTLSFT
jgi:hypothetical protein